MTRILLPEHKERPLVFYLAMEEYIAGETGIGDAFFLWTVAPTVIFGRNQVMEAENTVSAHTDARAAAGVSIPTVAI